MLASLDDVNTHLPIDKLQATDGNPEILLHGTDVERLIKGYLSDAYSPPVLAAWADPDSTPEYIRAIAGRLVAAFYYARRYSENIPDWDRTYPQRIYNEAMDMLEKVRAGLVDLPEVAESVGTEFKSDFWGPTPLADPVFTMDMRF